MPELPEVETTKRGIEPYVNNQIIKKILVRNNKLRIPLNKKLIKKIIKDEKEKISEMDAKTDLWIRDDPNDPWRRVSPAAIFDVSEKGYRNKEEMTIVRGFKDQSTHTNILFQFERDELE